MNKATLRLFLTVSCIVLAFGMLSVYVAFQKKAAVEARKQAEIQLQLAQKAQALAEEQHKIALEQLEKCNEINQEMRAKLAE